MKNILIFLVMAAVLIAGCFGGGGGAGPAVSGYGLEITSFSIEPSEIRSGNKATFVLTVEDKGNYEANYKNTSFLLTLPSDWSPAKNFENLSRTMNPADPSVDRVGDVVSKKFRPEAPSFLKGQTRPDPITARAYYEYQTKASGFVYIYPYGEEIEETSNFKSSEAPIKMDIKTSPEAVVVEDADETFTLVIDVTNVGSGKVYKPDITNGAKTPEIDSNDYNKVKLSIDISGEDWEHNTTWVSTKTETITMQTSDISLSQMITVADVFNVKYVSFIDNTDPTPDQAEIQVNDGTAQKIAVGTSGTFTATEGSLTIKVNSASATTTKVEITGTKNIPISRPKFIILDKDCRGGDTIEPTKGKQHYFSEYELFGKTNPTTTIMCDVQVNHNIITTKTPVSIEVVARYGYYTETSGSIKIVGRQ